ncbi:MAG: hypothetical protein ACPGU5_00030 [Lishizhenia sp.]
MENSKRKISEILFVISCIILISCEGKKEISEALIVTKEIIKTNEKLDKDIKEAENLTHNREGEKLVLDTSFIFRSDTTLKIN